MITAWADDSRCVTPSQLAQAQRVLALASAGLIATTLPDREAIKALLLPVLAKSPAERTDLGARLDQASADLGHTKTSKLVPTPSEAGTPASEAVQESRRWNLGLAVGAAFIGAILGLILFILPLAEAPKQTAIKDPPPLSVATANPVRTFQDRFTINRTVLPTGYEAIVRGLPVLPLLGFAWWLAKTHRRHRQWQERWRMFPRSRLPRFRLAAANGAFDGPPLREAARDLRRHRRIPTSDLDARQTVRSTVAAAGRFVPSYRSRPQTPAYTVLIEEHSTHDHVARLVDTAVDRLQEEGVHVERYYFQSDPTRLLTGDSPRKAVSLEEVVARGGSDSLVVFGTAEGLLYPFTGEARDWVKAHSAAWSSKALLHQQPIERWSEAELAVLDEGFVLGTATTSGVRALGEYMSYAAPDAQPLLEGIRLVRRRPAMRLPTAKEKLLEHLRDLRVQLEIRREASADDETVESANSLVIELRGWLAKTSREPDKPAADRRSSDLIQRLKDQLSVLGIQPGDVLDELQVETPRELHSTKQHRTKPISLVYSYLHEDEELRRRLEKHLSVLRRSGAIAEWHDRNIDASEDWTKKIDNNLETADIILLLISASFIASDYCWGREIKRALERHMRGEAIVIPVILKPCLWGKTPLGELQALPKDGMPVTSWQNQDIALDDIAAGIHRVVGELRGRIAAPPQTPPAPPPILAKKERRARNTRSPTKPISLLYSYSHEDENLRLRLQKHLSILRRNGSIAEWHDRDIQAGEDWAEAIDKNLETADIVLLLVSASFIASDYCWGKEMTKALDRHSRDEAKVIPVILRPCRWKSTPFANLQALPDDGKPVTTWQDQDDALHEVAAGIERVVEELRIRSTGSPQTSPAAPPSATPPLGKPSPVLGAAEAYDSSVPDLAVFRDIDAPWCPEMVALPAGRFLMGSPDNGTEGSAAERPRHEVAIDYRFAVGRYPVTFEEYDRFCDATKREKPGDWDWGRGRRPVINVSWEDARAYCAWLAEQTGRAYRLPSEAEWEYACRAGTTTRFAFGEVISEKDANFGYKVGKTTEVGTYPANAWGLYDLHGNVWEWVTDPWHGSYEGAPADGSVWSEGGDESRRVVRGGSWDNRPEYLRSACRLGVRPDNRSNYRGFRVARTLAP